MRFTLPTGAAMLLGAVLTACGTETAPTAVRALAVSPDAVALHTPEHVKLVEQFLESLTNPCNGEVIVFSGEAISQITTVDGLHFEFQTSASGTGTGPESGATYTYNLVAHESFNTSSETASHLDRFANANARIISSDPSLSFTSHFVNHFIFLPSGDFKLTRNVERTECKT